MISSVASGRRLAPTPNLYASSTINPFDKVSQEHRNNLAKVLYATDRNPKKKNGKIRTYGIRRSESLGFGFLTLRFGHDIPWDVLVRESLAKKRTVRLPVSVSDIDESGRFPPTPLPLVMIDGKRVDDPIVLEEHADTERLFLRLLGDCLSSTRRHEAYVFVPGHRTQFQAAASHIAQLWHFMGREGVPVLYSWPAVRGAVWGYPYNRESGEFTIFHLKQFLRLLASCPGLEKIHLISHSRGTDVLITALRELHIEDRGAGKNTRLDLKLGNLVVIAADIDFHVMRQRISAERLGQVPERVTLYTSLADSAIRLNELFFRSIRRIGRMGLGDFTADMVRKSALLPAVQMINVRVGTGLLGHSYYCSNPAVISDLILLLRDNLDPGGKNGRPLTWRIGNYWELHGRYPLPPAPKAVPVESRP